jgi:hypothetical protein
MGGSWGDAIRVKVMIGARTLQVKRDRSLLECNNVDGSGAQRPEGGPAAPLAGAPEFLYPAYAVYAANAEPALLTPALAALRKAAGRVSAR